MWNMRVFVGTVYSLGSRVDQKYIRRNLSSRRKRALKVFLNVFPYVCERVCGDNSICAILFFFKILQRIIAIRDHLESVLPGS